MSKSGVRDGSEKEPNFRSDFLKMDKRKGAVAARMKNIGPGSLLGICPLLVVSIEYLATSPDGPTVHLTLMVHLKSQLRVRFDLYEPPLQFCGTLIVVRRILRLFLSSTEGVVKPVFLDTLVF